LLGFEVLRVRPEGRDLDLLLTGRDELNLEVALLVGLGVRVPVAGVVAIGGERADVNTRGGFAGWFIDMTL
jgi:hypothetical protein